MNYLLPNVFTENLHGCLVMSSHTDKATGMSIFELNLLFFQSFPSSFAFLRRRELGEQQYLSGEKNSNLNLKSVYITKLHSIGIGFNDLKFVGQFIACEIKCCDLRPRVLLEAHGVFMAHSSYFCYFHFYILQGNFVLWMFLTVCVRE